MAGISGFWGNITDFLDKGGTIYISETWEIPIYGLILLGIICFVVFLIFKFIKSYFSHLVKISSMSPEVYNTIVFFLRLGVGVLFIWLIMTFLKVNSSYILIVSGITATAIAFASVKTINNFVAGIWIALTQPYIQGDFINIENTEGVVVNISSFYTRIKTCAETTVLIPNLSGINANILNYTLNINNYQKKVKNLKEQIEKLQGKSNNKKKKPYVSVIKQLTSELNEKEKILENISHFQTMLNQNTSKESELEYIQKNKIIRYVFNVALNKNYDSNVEKLNAITKSWNENHKSQIEFQLVNILSHLIYEFVMYSLNPMRIIKNLKDLKSIIYKNIYSQ